jgi:N-acetylglucosamine kinase-like BadF-type ATPase
MVEGTYVVGVDGGGTKTEAVLVDERGQVLGWGTGRPANPNRVSPEELLASLQEAIGQAMSGHDGVSGTPLAQVPVSGTSPAAATREAILAQVPVSGAPPAAVWREATLAQAPVSGAPPAAVCFGLAGATGNQELVQEVAAKLGIGKKVVVVSDVVIAFWSAITQAPGVVVVAGTGSCAYGVGPQGEPARAGGWGYLVGDEGSGYDVGRAGIAAALRAFDGRGPATALVERLLQYFHLDTVSQVVPALYHPSGGDSKARISDFALVVVQAALEGDAVSHEILRHAGHELGLSAAAVARRLALCDREFELGLVGGAFKAGGLIVEPLRDVVLQSAPRARIFVSPRPPALGAARLAWRVVGREIAVGV